MRLQESLKWGMIAFIPGALVAQFINGVIGVGLGVIIISFLYSQKISQLREQIAHLQVDGGRENELAELVITSGKVIANTATEVNRDMESLLGVQTDAIQTLTDSFTQIRELLERQQSDINQLLYDSPQRDGQSHGRLMKSFAENTSLTLNKFVDTTVYMSAASMGLMEKVSAIAEQMPQG